MKTRLYSITVPNWVKDEFAKRGKVNYTSGGALAKKALDNYLNLSDEEREMKLSTIGSDEPKPEKIIIRCNKREMTIIERIDKIALPTRTRNQVMNIALKVYLNEQTN